MRILFVGPTLHGCNLDLGGIEVRGPASFGDVAQAVSDGATIIGIVDGCFESLAAVWHKEILFALSRGIEVLGAASMGALRAAECAQFGMQPVGWVAHAYLSGELADDAAVAQVHGPKELGYPPLSETLVDSLWTIQSMERRGVISEQVAESLEASARRLFFKDRTIEAIVDGADMTTDRQTILKAFRASICRIKTRDAVELVERMKSMKDPTYMAERDWIFAESPFWMRTMSDRFNEA